MIGKLKRTLAMALALCMVFSLCPVSAMAEELAPEVPVCEHSYAESERTEATCTADGSVTMSCSACGDTYTEALPAGHSWSEWTEADGLKSRSCTVCGESESEALPVVKQELSGEYTPLYFYNEEGWAEVYAAWLFDEEDFDDLALPGVAMSATALEGVWAVSVPVEADAIIFGNGITGAGERGLESRIPAEGDLYAQGEWQYSYAFTAPLAATGSFSVSAKGSGTVSIDGSAVTGSVELDAGEHDIKVAPAFGEGYYVKSLSIGGTAVNLDDQSFSQGACTVSYTLAPDETAKIEVEFALYRPAMTGTLELNGFSASTRWDNLENKILNLVLDGDVASSGYTIEIKATLFSSYDYHSMSSVRGMDYVGGLAGQVGLDVPGSELYKISFSGNERYPAFDAIEGITITNKEARPKPKAECSLQQSGSGYYVEMDAQPANWNNWAKSVITVAAGETDITANATYNVTAPSSFPAEGQTATCTVKVSVKETQNYTALAEQTFTITVKNPQYPAGINVTNPSDEKGLTAEIKVYTDAACTAELSNLSSVAAGTYYVKAIAQPGCQVESLTVAGQIYESELETGKALALTLGNTEAKQYSISATAKRLTYTVEFVDYDGTELDTVSGLYYGDTTVYGGETPTKAADGKYTYTFAGWKSSVTGQTYAADAQLPDVTGDATYTATYNSTLNQYTITWIVDGEKDVDTYNFGDEVTAPATPGKEGHTFAGWGAEIPETMPAENLTFTAKWTVNQYTVSFNTDGGSAVAPITADYGTAISAPAAPTKTGYTFDGWDAEIPATMPAGNLTITAKWTVNQYTISFDTDGGSEVDEITQNYGTAVTAPAAPTKEGHTFAGWDTEIPATMPAEDMTITAKWTVNKYTVTFVNYNGDVLQSGEVAYGQMPAYTQEEPTKAGDSQYSYTFIGWEPQIAKVTGEAVYTAQFSNADVFYTITFIDEDGDVLDTASRVYGATPYYKDGTPTKAADDKYTYTFAGWKSSVTGQTYAADEQLPDVTVDASYTATYTSTPKKYTITFDTDGGSKVDAITQDYGSAVTAPAAPSKEGYTFDGWDTEIPATMPAGNLTITAKWTVNRYTVTWIVDGEEDVDTYNFGDTVTAPANPGKTGYTFDGWDTEIPATMPAGNLTITAKWTVNQYTVTWVVDGEEDVDTYNFGDTVTAPADPGKTGYTFDGWDAEIPAAMPAENLEFTAKWKVNQYTISFNTDGGSTVAAITQDYGSAITAPAAPTKTDCVFIAWNPSLPATMPAVNMTVKAKWADDINHNGIDDSIDTRYTVIYDYNGNGWSNYGKSVLVGLATPTVADPTWDNHVFLGWSPAVSDTVTGDVTYTAQWADDKNENGADDSTETAQINLTVSGGDCGTVKLEESFARTVITDNGDGSYTVLFDSKTAGANVITVSATANDTDGSDGSADYIDSLSHETLAVENGVTYDVTAAFATRSIAASNGEIFINRFEAGNALTDNAAAKAITGALREDILEAAGLDADEPYIVAAVISYEGHSISVVFGEDGVEGSLPVPGVDIDQAGAYALSRLNGMDVKISLAADGKLPAVEKNISIAVREARPAATISLDETVIEMDFDKANQVEAAARANVSVTYGSGTTTDAWTLTADKTAEELMTGELQTITYKVTVAETANYTGAEASFTVKATHKTYEPIISLTEATDDGDAAYSISGSTVTVTAAPDEGCYVESVVCTLDGESIAVTGSYAADRSYTAAFETQLGNDSAKEYDIVVSYGRRSIAKNSSIPNLTYNEDEATLLKAVYAAIVDEANSEGGIAYGKVSVTVNKTVTGAGTYEFTVTWADDSVANKYPTVTAKAEIVLTNELILSPVEQQSLTAPVVNGEIALTEQDVLAAVDAGNVPDTAGLEKTLLAPSVDEINAALTKQGDSVEVTVKISAGGEGTPYDPAEAEVTLTISAPVNQAKISVEAYENGSLKINGTETAAGTDSYAPGDYTLSLKGNGEYVPNTIVISLDGSELQSLVGEAAAEFSVIDGSGKAHDYVPEYIVSVSFAVPAVEIPETATMNYYVGMENDAQQLEQLAMEALENGEGGVVYTPADLEEGSGKLSYRAREAKTYIYTATIDPRDYGIGFIPAQTVEVPVQAGELWLDLGESFTPAVEPTQEQIKAIVDRVINTYGINALMSMYENDRDQLIAILKAEIMKDPVFVNYYNYYGAHRFGDDVTNTELVKLSVDSDKYGVLESNTSLLTLDDTRIETEISASTGVELVYGFSAEALIEALGASVTAKDGADLGVPQIETDVEAMCASDELQTVKLFYPGNSKYRRCSAEVQILVKRAGVDVFVDNRLIRWEEGLSYELPVGTDPAGVDTITFIAGLNVANADIDAGAIGSGNPVVGLRGDIILLIPDALSSALAYVGIPTEGYMSLGDVKDALLKLADISGLTNSTNESISQLITMLESISGDKLDAGVYIGSELPTEIGVYVVGAVSADANYETDFGAGYIIIAPNGVKAKLSWNMTDDNHAFTLDKLESFDFGASAEVIESTLDGANMPGSAQHHLEYLFVGVDDEGELLIDRCTDPNSVELGMGVYSQVAYIANWGNAMYYAEPIARPIIVTPNVADVAILDSNGNENYAQLLTYDGSAKAVTVTVDGKTVTEGLTVRYIGSDLSADGWYRENAPTDAGAYTVVAIYTEKDADGKLVKAGAAVAGLVIKPAAADIELNDAEYTYDGNEYFAEIGNGGFDYITAAVDRANNTVYVNLPDDIGAHLSRLSGMLPEAAQTKLDAFLAKYESFDGDVQTATVNAELVGILNTIINADTSAAAEAKARELAAAIIDKLAANEEIKAAYAKLKAELEALKAKVGEELPDEIEAKLIEYLKNVISVGEDGVDVDVAQIKASLYAKIAELESKLPASVVSQLRAMADELIAVVEANLDREAIEAEIDKLVATLESLDSDDAKTVVKYVLGALYGYADESGLKSFISQAYAKLDAQTYIDYAKSMIDSIAGIYGGSIDTSGVEAAIEALAKDVKAKIESGSFDADDLDALETDVDAILSALVAVLNRAPDVKAVFGKNPVEAGEYDCYIVNVSKNYAPELAKAVLVIKPAEVTVTMDSHDLALNDAIPELSYTIEGLVGDDKLTVTPSCDIVDTGVVGSYTVSASVSENPNYVITVVDGTITVSDKRSQVTITAKEDAEVEISDSLTYDDVIAVLEIAVSDAAGNGINDYELVIKDAEGNIVEPADLVAGESYTAVVTFKGNTTQAPAEKEISFTAVDSREGLYAIDLSGNTVGVGEGSVVEIDGVKYVVEEDSIVWVSETTHKIVVSYNWASSTSTVEPNYDGGTGPHYEYPCNMYVWYLSFENDSYTAERIEDLDDFLSYKGTSIRMTGKQGIRIFTAVNEADRAKLINGSLISHEALAGYKLVEYGTLFAMAEKYGDLTVENGLRSYAYSTAQGRDAVFSRSGGDIWYTGMLVDLDVELCDDELLIRPYMIIEGPDGEQLTIYGGTLQRTIGYVALQNRDYKPTQAAHDFIWNIIYAVYGEDFEYNY